VKRVAIIPARGGSKRIPSKNIRDFFGRPIIAYTLEAALRADLFDVIHVSTESPEIMDVVQRLGFPVDFPRPPDLAGDDTPIRDVLKFVVQTYRARGRDFGAVFRLSACAPLLDAADLQAASGIFDAKSGRHPVLSVATYAVPIEWAYQSGPEMTLTAVDAEMTRVRSQDIAPKYHDAGLFSVLPVGLVDLHPAPYPHPFIGYPVARERAVDIDGMEDWNLAARLFAGTQSHISHRDAPARLNLLKTDLEIHIPPVGSLRALRPADVTPAYVDGLNDPRVNRFIQSARQTRQTHDSVMAYVASNWADDRAILFGVYADRILRGTIRIHDIDWELRSGTMGIALFDVAAWNRGLATGAITAATRCVRDLLGLCYVRAGIDPDNAASIRVFEKAGFVRMRQPRRDVGQHDRYFWVYEGKSAQREPPT
jgi:N-acylneuraminate cytidylyltransferase